MKKDKILYKWARFICVKIHAVSNTSSERAIVSYLNLFDFGLLMLFLCSSREPGHNASLRILQNSLKPIKPF